MDSILKQFLLRLIPKTTISVFHDETGSDYTIPADGFGEILEDIISDTPDVPEDVEELLYGDETFTISCEYFINGSVPYGSYSLEYGELVLYTATSPMFNRPTNRTARDLISLANACSKKIIKQQKMAQQRNMILGMAQNNQNIS